MRFDDVRLADLHKTFDPTEARDARGRWTAGGESTAPAASRLKEIRAAGGQRLVYRGAIRPDFKPKERDYGAVYVTTSKSRARDYANPTSITGKPLGSPGWVTVYALPLSTPLADMARLYSQPMTPIQRRAKIRWSADLSRKLWAKPSLGMMLRDAKLYGQDIPGEGDPANQDAILEGIHVGPTSQDDAFLRRLGFKGSKRGHAMALADPSILTALYARRTDAKRRIVMAKAFDPTEARDDYGRWTSSGISAPVAAAVAGTVAGGLASHAAIARTRGTAFRRVHDAAQVLSQERHDTAIRAFRHRQAEAAIERGLRSPVSLVPTAVRSLASMANRRERFLRRHQASHQITIDPSKNADLIDLFGIDMAPVTSGTHLGSSDPMGELQLQTRAANLRSQIVDLNTNARLPLARDRLGHWRAARRAAAADPKLALMTEEARGRRIVEGYPGKKARRDLSQQIRKDLADRTKAFTAAEAKRLTARIATRRTAIKATQRGALGVLRHLRGTPRLAVIGTAAALGGLGSGYLSHRLFGKLAKAANTDQPRQTPTNSDNSGAIFDAGAGVESSLATRLARTLGSWTRIPADQLATPNADLYASMASDMAAALTPLDTAATGGNGVAVPGVDWADPAGGRLITASFDIAHPAAVDVIRTKRLKLAGQIAAEQMQTIQAILTDATLNGQAPATTARLLRQSIGLTPTQAGHVVSFSRQLETLDPRVLDRAVRDKRYDRTVQGAIDSGTPLSDEQISNMTDAYQRRYLALRAMTIARTEGVGAANNGHMDSLGEWLDANPDFTVIKTWIATNDSRTRDTHVYLNGKQVIGYDTPFTSSTGEQLLWPHDPDGSAAECVNCRCSCGTFILPRSKAAEQGLAALDTSPYEDAAA